MDCKEFERLVPAFIGRKLDYRTLKRFREHVETCDNCKEELVIQFLITEGMIKLEEGSAFDLQKELDLRMTEAERKIRFHSGFEYLGVLLEICLMLAIAGVVMWILL